MDVVKRQFTTILLLVIATATLWLRGDIPATTHVFESSIAAFEAQDKKDPPPNDANLFIGSSSIRKWKSLAADFPKAKVINRGFGGSRLADCTFFADRVVIPYHPRRIFLYAGDNDLASKRTPEQVAADFKAFVEKVRTGLPEARIYYISIKPSPARAALIEQMRQTNTLIEEYTKSGKTLFYVDVFTSMLGADGQARPELFGPDHLHMNEAGYAIWTKILTPLVD